MNFIFYIVWYSYSYIVFALIIIFNATGISLTTIGAEQSWIRLRRIG